MLSHGMADSAQLDILTKLLNEYCEKHHITRREEREEIAVKLFCLFKQGLEDPAQLAVELERVG
ncbi:MULTISPECIES: hypothetical protein [unclassified Mesorhizobium]|uniref:hypothetical protein n=1 Tax=unclassified Mesorhizobium TaxID=325217 RepID=UPI000BB03EEB|nr:MULTISPECIES: hypothetical protein [unclassified Mesorhizobium]PBB83532.1 hypothetical protein CK216_28340 [Mesorhizobium sp. WSM3876]RWE21885.1 MAG: hypothetical protein EOS41_25765 [Mesorhizobium sp.]